MMYHPIREFITVLLYLTSDRKGGPGEFRVQNDPVQVRRTDSSVRPYYDNFGLYDIRNAIRFRLWTRENPILAHEILVHDTRSLRSSSFDSRRLTKIFVHGKDQRSNEERLDPETVFMRDAYLRFADVNYILVDWTSLAQTYRYFTNYGDFVSQRIVDFLTFLERHGTPLGSVHMIGLSWGAHVIGKAGHMLGGRIGRLTGLDPAGPLYHSLPEREVLDKSDGVFVDIIHTDAGGPIGLHSGIPRVLGHVDFFPNGGKVQPGCPPRDYQHHKDLPCSHERSVDLFSESIGSPLSFPSCQKGSWEEYVRDKDCTNDTFMGEHIPITTRGVFYLRTHGRRPFGTGTPLDVILPNIPGVRRGRIIFDPTRFRFHRISTALNPTSRRIFSNNHILPPSLRPNPTANITTQAITSTETNYSPSNGTNLVFYPTFAPYTRENYPNDDVLRHCLHLIRRKNPAS